MAKILKNQFTWEDREIVLGCISALRQRISDSKVLPSNKESRETFLAVHPELNCTNYVDELYISKDADAVMRKVQKELDKFNLADYETAIVHPDNFCEVR